MIETYVKALVLCVNGIALGYFAILNTTYLVMSFIAYWGLRRHARRLKLLDIEDLILTSNVPPITLICPAFNEENTCVEAIRALCTLNYPSYEVIFVNDGSEDSTMQRLINAFSLAPTDRMPMADLQTAWIRGVYQSESYPDLWVIDKVNGGKSDALNAGLTFCRTPLFCAMDSDSLLERDALTRIVRPFLEDATTIAAGGSIRIANGCTVRSGVLEEVSLPRSLLARFQVLEYLRAFLAGRMGWDVLNATIIISGAFGMFRRQIVIEAGGFSTNTVGEDMELIVRLHRYCREKGIPHRVAFVPDPLAWTECPESVVALGRQRDRWQRGLIDSLTWHVKMLFNPRYGRIGMTAFPHFFFLEMLGPLVETLGYISFVLAIAFGLVNNIYIAAFLMVAFVLGAALSIAAIGLEELSLRRYPGWSNFLQLFVLAILENIGYRQLVTFWRMRGILSSVLGVKTWGRMSRRGFSGEEIL
jgi:cellulose synthase/poly-beta-1,6-N-acetylglucosamine synthase-like glycosyltransferase